MGETAENLAEAYGISRDDQDAFALNSHQKAVHAAGAGWFDAETVSVPVVVGKERREVTRDEGPRVDASLAALGKLKPAFRAGGTVTAGNSSTLNDGAAAIVVADEDAARRYGLTARARVRAVASAGVDPRHMGIGPVPAVQKALVRAGLSVEQVDAWELNEAFAAQALAVIRTLGLREDRVNLHGGAIALGHPLGCSGARILITLLGVLERTGGTVGCATLCVGVGQGLAVIVERTG
jgi:acetyl-CoA acetyltransferase family protein